MAIDEKKFLERVMLGDGTPDAWLDQSSSQRGLADMPFVTAYMSAMSGPTVDQDSIPVVQLSIINLRVDGNLVQVGEYATTAFTIDRYRPGVDASWGAAVSVTPAVTEAAGYAHSSYTFPAASWQNGDQIRYTASGCIVTIAGQTIYVPTMYCYGVVGGVAEIVESTDAIEAWTNAQMTFQEVFFTTNIVKNATTTMITLNAVGGAIYDIKLKMMVDDDALATYTIFWEATRPNDLVTFAARAWPAAIVVATPAADTEVNDIYGDLAEDLQVRLRITQDNAGDATNATDGCLTFWSTA